MLKFIKGGGNNQKKTDVGGEDGDEGGISSEKVMVADLMDLQALPEGCIANVVSLTTPRDACRLSMVSRRFKSASESDAVWGRFLPPDIHTILARSVHPHTHQPVSKKELYLTEYPVLVKQGRMSFSLDKWGGKKCYMISARGLSIVWGDTPRYWRWISVPDSRFEEVAELAMVCWFEIRGKIDARLLSPSTLYEAYLVFKSSADGVYGFDDAPVEVTVGMAGEEPTLDPENVGHQPGEINESQYPKEREDGWLEIEMGEFFCEGYGEFEMSCKEVWNLHWKHGLIIEGIEIRPKRIM